MWLLLLGKELMNIVGMVADLDLIYFLNATNIFFKIGLSLIKVYPKVHGRKDIIRP